MIIIWGTRLAGKCDVVPNLFYVRSQFFHIWYIPLIPLKSYLIMHGSETDGGFQGTQISMSGKSVLFGWLRTGAVVGGLISIVMMVLSVLDYTKHHELESLAGAMLGLVLLGGCVLTYWACELFSKASRDRAYQLAEHLGMTPEVLDEILYRMENPQDEPPPDEPPPDVLPAEEEPPEGMPSARPRLRRDDDEYQ